MTHEVFAANLRRIIARAEERGEAADLSKWARLHGLSERNIRRILANDQCPSLDSADEIAQALGLQVWQLLMPNLDPDNPPVFVMTEVESELYQRIKADFRKLR